MTEWEHDHCLCERVRYLINHPKPAAHISQRLGAGEREDVVHERRERLDPCVRDPEAKEVHLSGTKLEFLGIEDAATCVTSLQELADSMEIIFN